MNSSERQRTDKRGRVVAACIVGDCRYLAGPLVWCLIRPGFGVGVTRESVCTNDMDYSFIIAPSSSRSKYCVQFACYCYILTTRIAPGLYKARRALYKRAYRAYRIRASDRFGQKITYGIRAGSGQGRASFFKPESCSVCMPGG